MRVIFLDIDGVLNDMRQHGNGFFGTNKENVEVMNTLLSQFPDAKIVISSSWRYMIQEKSMTVDGFTNMLLSHGLDCLSLNGSTSYKHGGYQSRVLGRTALDEEIKGRGKQIKSYLECHPSISNFVIFDDMLWDFEKYPHLMTQLILTDPATGVTPKQIEQAAKLLTKTKLI